MQTEEDILKAIEEKEHEARVFLKSAKKYNELAQTSIDQRQELYKQLIFLQGEKRW